jgi:PAS domain S-box-containing protein
MITYSNLAHHTILGYADGELTGCAIWDFQPTDDDKRSLKAFFEKLTTEQPSPFPYFTSNRRKDGSLVKLQVDWNYLRDISGTLVGFVSIITDVTEQNRKQESLVEHSRGLNSFLKVSRHLAATLDLEKILQAAAEGVTDLAGLDTSAIYLLEDSMLRLWAAHPPLPAEFPDTLRLSSRGDHPHFERAITSHEPLLLPDALTVSLTKAEETVVMTRNLRTLLYLPLIAEGEVMGSLIVGSIGTPIVISKDSVRLSSAFANLAALAVKNAGLYKAKKLYAARLEQSLTEQKRAEAEREILRNQLFQAQKMDAVGRLAGGIAHDFNNQLGGIMGFADLLLNELSDQNHKKFAAGIVSLAQRSADLVSQLLAFSRKGPIRYILVDLHAVIDEVISILEHTLHRKIAIRKILDGTMSRTLGDSTQIQSALLNLALNAKDAMPDGGELIFRTETVTVDPNDLKRLHLQLRPGLYTLLSVTDTGCGMDASTMERIFEPFFTTKEQGRGTGMGLAAVFGTMKTYGGEIVVESTLDQGSTFNLYFPVADVEQAALLDSTPAATEPGREIPFVDDEQMPAEARRPRRGNRKKA